MRPRVYDVQPDGRDRALLMCNAIQMAAERLSDLVGDLAEDLADNYL